ncbi:hypothetical protein CCR75_000283 [Bremia lactucae]|uniref:Uncharacterized protein n=1 Tax=Bremia lactucae TaxID=4779 RepID=A0A976FLF8_BRELC|nr:hypothetical protein CCR75_000283 [Bremia lactucae]
MPQNVRKFCKHARSWHGTLIESDHKLVTADIALDQAYRLRRHTRARSWIPASGVGVPLIGMLRSLESWLLMWKVITAVR